MPIMGEASTEICIGQLRIRHRALVANMENDCKHCDEVEQPKARFHRMKKASWKMMNGLQLCVGRQGYWSAPQMERR